MVDWHGMPSQMSRDEVRRFILEGEEILVEAKGAETYAVSLPPGGDQQQRDGSRCW